MVEIDGGVGASVSKGLGSSTNQVVCSSVYEDGHKV